MRLVKSLLTFICMLAPPASVSAQQLGGGGTGDVSLVRVFLALLVCLIIAVLAVLLLRQKLQGRGLPLLTKFSSTTSRIRLIESRRIAPQSDLCLVACDAQEYLLLIAPGGASVLDRRPSATETDEVAG